MKIQFHYVGNVHNTYSGVWGVTNHIVPVINALSKKHDVYVDCDKKGIDMHSANTFIELLQLEPVNLELANVKYELNNDCDILFCEARIEDNEFIYCVKLIRKYIKNKKIVFLLDNNLWANEYPVDIKNNVILLRPYVKENYQFKNQFFYPYNIHTTMQNKKIIDFAYVGNEWGREKYFETYIAPLNATMNTVVVAGNWLKYSKWYKYSNLHNILFVNELPHNYAISLLSCSRFTLQIVKDDYRKVGMMTNRIFESNMGRAVCFADKEIYKIKQFIPHDALISDTFELREKISKYSNNLNKYNSLLQEQDKLLQRYTPGYACNLIENASEFI